ncbi:MAG: hypothetical protein LBB84_12715 [Tannerellaceae bacterium]|nr:hypothetical protein [Tannerellaceae bacterium]
MAESIFPRPIAGFTEYMKIAYSKAQVNLQTYHIAPDKLAVISPLYNTYVQAEAVAANPDTATSGARRTRDEVRKTLESVWRQFLNENIRYNSAVPVGDLEVFGIKKRDKTRTPPGIPLVAPALSIRKNGVRRFEIGVLNGEIGKKKKPQNAAGSYLYLAVTGLGEEPKHENEYHRLAFSSKSLHVVEFPLEQFGQQAHIYARYSNVHGEEGPKGIREIVLIG